MRLRKSKSIIFLLIAINLISMFSTSCSRDNHEFTPVPSGGTSFHENLSSATNGEGNTQPAGPVEIEMFINHPWYPLKNWEGSIPEEITKRTGVRLNLTIASDDKQLLMLIASGELPEMIFTDSSYFKRLSDYKLSYSWNKLIEQYAPDFKIDSKKAAIFRVSDGNFYTILSEFGTREDWNSEKYAMPIGGGLCFRKDLFEKLGSPKINSLEDLEQVLEMAKNQYQGVAPLIMNPSWKGTFISYQYGLAMNKGFVEDDKGRAIYYIKQEGVLDYYKTMNRFYRKGYLDPQNYVYKNEEQSYKIAIDGKCFAYMDMNSTADDLNAKSAAAGTDYQFVQLVNPLREKAAYYNTGIGWSGVFITRNNKHPNESINLMKFLSSEEGRRLSYWGIEGRHWTMNPAGYPDFKINTADEAALVKEGIKWSGLFATDAITEGLFNYNPRLKQTSDAAKEIKKRTIYLPALGMLLPETNTSENSIKSRIDDMIKNEEIKIYLAKTEQECIMAYKNMLTSAEKLGMSDLEVWANSEYSRAKELINNEVYGSEGGK